MLIPFLDQPVTIRCQQLLATDIELEPGERITTTLESRPEYLWNRYAACHRQDDQR